MMPTSHELDQEMSIQFFEVGDQEMSIQFHEVTQTIVHHFLLFLVAWGGLNLPLWLLVDVLESILVHLFLESFTPPSQGLILLL